MVMGTVSVPFHPLMKSPYHHQPQHQPTSPPPPLPLCSPCFPGACVFPPSCLSILGRLSPSYGGRFHCLCLFVVDNPLRRMRCLCPLVRCLLS